MKVSDFMEVIKIDVDNENNERIDAFLSSRLDLTRTRIQQLIKEKNVIVNGKHVKPSYKVEENDSVQIVIPDVEEIEILPENIPIDIVFEDDNIVIINKNYGMVVHPAHGNYSGTLVNAILYHIKGLSGINGEHRPGIVHRLDKDTSGLIVVAKNDKAHFELANMFQNREIKKTYLTIVKGKLKNKKGRIVTQIGRDSVDRKKMTVVTGIGKGKNAITNYEVICENDKYSLLKVNIETGRTHQIRVHMKYIGNPILGDTVYGKKDEKIKRQMLHAYKLQFLHPINKNEIVIFGEIPDDFKKVMESNGFNL